MAAPTASSPTDATVDAHVRAISTTLSAATRHIFQTQLISAQPSLSDVQAQLPELCACLRRLASAAIRRVFIDARVAWISRSSLESGMTAIVSAQLVHLARRRVLSPLDVVHVFLDQLLSPLHLGATSPARGCTWRGQPPAFHEMPCFRVWDALLPSLQRLAQDHPGAFAQAIDERTATAKASTSSNATSVMCAFAHVNGFWRLLDGMPSAKPALAAAIIKHVLQTYVLAGSVAGSANALLDDLLMEKFLLGLQEFTFKTSATTATAEALADTVVASIRSIAATDALTSLHGVCLFTSASCVFLPSVATHVGNLLIEDTETASNQTTQQASNSVVVPVSLRVLVAFCAHMALVPAILCLRVMQQLLSGFASTRDPDYLHLVLYVAVHRAESLAALTTDADGVPAELLDFQDAFMADVELPLLFSLPLDWTKTMWTQVFGLPTDQVEIFAKEHAIAHAVATDDAPLIVDSKHLLALALQPSSSAPKHTFKRVTNLLGSAYVPFQTPREIVDANALRLKRRRLLTRASGGSHHHDHVVHPLLMPEVMEHVFSFMSAKRLCRLALVSRLFADVTTRGSLWERLYRQLGPTVECPHGALYEHDWKALYIERRQVLKKLRVRHRRDESKQRRRFEEDEDVGYAGSAPAPVFSAQLCRLCGCHRILGSQQELAAHWEQHKRFQCLERTCRALFINALALKRHTRDAHTPVVQEQTVTATDKASKARITCGTDGCTKSYVSLKRLATHQAQQHNQNEK